MIMDTLLQEMADRITNLFDQTFATLIERRDSRYASEIAPLDTEREALLREDEAIQEATANLAKTLPARARQASREADVLLLAGKNEEAEKKLAEAQEAERAPAAIAAQRGEISARVAVLDEEKRAIARRIFGEWYSDVQHVIRPAEHGLFIVLLDGFQSSFSEFQNQTATGPDAWGRTPGLFNQSHISGLAAAEQSAEGQAGRRWYGGRVG